MGNCVSRRPTQSGLSQDIEPPGRGEGTPGLDAQDVQNDENSALPHTLAPLKPSNGTQMCRPRLPASSNDKVSIGDTENTIFENGAFGCLDSRCNSVVDPNESMTATMRFLNGGYWPSWKHYEGVTPSHVPLDTLTHVNYAFADIDGDGTVYLADEFLHYEVDVDGTNGGLRAWTRKKGKNPNLKVTLAVGGGASPKIANRFAEVAGDTQKRFNFTQSIKHIVDIFGLDGVDIDWEHPTGPAEAEHYIRMLTDLRRNLGWGRWVTTALPAGQWALKYLDLAGISQIVDFINLMAYDFVGPSFANVKKTGHLAQLYATGSAASDSNTISGADAVDYLLEHGVPSRKIMLGVPAYGRVFKGANGPDQEFEGSGSSNEATFEVKDLPKPGMTEIFDDNAIATFASSNREFITYDNKESVRKKAAFVKQKNLRGLFYWHLAGDRSGDESLVRGGYEALVGEGVNRFIVIDDDKPISSTCSDTAVM